MSKEWREIDFENYFSCGSNVEGFTDAPEGLWDDSDEVRCVECHYPGWISVCEESCYVMWVEDGYVAEAALRIESLTAQLEAVKDALITVLPMAKGYAAQNNVGRNKEMIAEAEKAIRGGEDE